MSDLNTAMQKLVCPHGKLDWSECPLCKPYPGLTIREELYALRQRADEASATSTIESMAETLTELIDFLLRLHDGRDKDEPIF